MRRDSVRPSGQTSSAALVREQRAPPTFGCTVVLSAWLSVTRSGGSHCPSQRSELTWPESAKKNAALDESHAEAATLAPARSQPPRAGCDGTRDAAGRDVLGGVARGGSE